MIKIIARSFLILGVCFFLFFIFHQQTFASISSCSASADTSSFTANNNYTVTYTVNNNDGGTAAQWVSISAGSSNISFSGQSADGWNGNVSAQTITFDGGSLGAGGSGNFLISMSA